MGNGFLWEKAREIDRSLVGENWPDKLNLEQIAKLRFPDNVSDRKSLLRNMDNQAKTGSLEFNEVSISSYWNKSSNTSVAIIGNDGGCYEILREMKRKENETTLIENHTPRCGWIEALKGGGQGDSIQLEQHPCGCNCVCTIKEVFPNGLPKRWRVEGVHDDAQKISISLFAEPLLTAKQCRDYLKSVKQDAPTDSVLFGWWDDAGSQEPSEPTSTIPINPSGRDNVVGGIAGANPPINEGKPKERQTYLRKIWEEHNKPKRNAPIWAELKNRARVNPDEAIKSVFGNDEFKFEYKDGCCEPLTHKTFQNDMTEIRKQK